MNAEKPPKESSKKTNKTAKKAPAKRGVPKRKKAAPAVETTPIAPPVPVSLRLPGELLAELRSVATERRNRGVAPYTQGAIIEVALREWLERNGG